MAATFITSNNSSHAHVCCCLRLQQARRKTPPGVLFPIPVCVGSLFILPQCPGRGVDLRSSFAWCFRAYTHLHFTFGYMRVQQAYFCMCTRGRCVCRSSVFTRSPQSTVNGGIHVPLLCVGSEEPRASPTGQPHRVLCSNKALYQNTTTLVLGFITDVLSA